MAGTVAGGLKAKAKNLSNDPFFYNKIGAKGGSVTDIPKGFALMSYEKRSEAGRKGGTISRRKPKTV